MKKFNATEIIRTIKNHVAECGGSHKDWYVGIATDPEKRLFSDHNVDKNSSWIYVEATNEKVARFAERILVRSHHFQGDTGGGDAPEAVYAYEITSDTRE